MWLPKLYVQKKKPKNYFLGISLNKFKLNREMEQEGGSVVERKGIKGGGKRGKIYAYKSKRKENNKSTNTNTNTNSNTSSSASASTNKREKEKKKVIEKERAIKC